MGSSKYLLFIAAALWVVWGLVHALAGVIVLSADATGGFQGIADAVPAEELVADYHAAVGAILNQHAWNLLWVGVLTVIGAVFVGRGNWTGIWVTALIAGLFDVGYFWFIDIGGFGNFMPGRVMTMFSGGAIVLSLYAVYADKARRGS